jgi:AraC-like DNA-binding protein
LRRELQQQRNKERFTTHGLSRHPMFIRWQGILGRLFNPNDSAYPNYGGRGIGIDPAWMNFHTFYQDMGNPPSPDHSIERIDNDGPYSKDNCRWATAQEQAMNRRSSRLVTAFDKTQTLTEWAGETGLTFNCIDHRLRRGKDTETALTKPPRQKRIITYNGVTQTLAEWAREIGISEKTLRRRLDDGMSPEEAFTAPVKKVGAASERYGELAELSSSLGINAKTLHTRLSRGMTIEEATTKPVRGQRKEDE